MLCTIDDRCVGGACGGDSTTCGDGVLQSSCGEQCDDGNVTSGDGCSASCQTEFVCAPAPQAGCKRPIAPSASKLQLKDKPSDAADALGWKWTKGAATAFAELGTPAARADYLLCIYDQRGLVLSALAPADQICAGKPCVTARPTGIKYKDKDATPDGVTGIDIKVGGAGQAKISVKGKGALLQMPSLPMSEPVTIQLRNGAGTCWEAIYSAPPLKNDSAQYQDKSD
jgi:cysteine-rich repeat protein